MISKAIEVSISKTYLKKIRLHWGEYECYGAEGITQNDEPTMIYLLFKIINPYTRIGVSNPKY